VQALQQARSSQSSMCMLVLWVFSFYCVSDWVALFWNGYVMVVVESGRWCGLCCPVTLTGENTCCSGQVKQPGAGVAMYMCPVVWQLVRLDVYFAGCVREVLPASGQRSVLSNSSAQAGLH
jgi:hypothetical protein